MTDAILAIGQSIVTLVVIMAATNLVLHFFYPEEDSENE